MTIKVIMSRHVNPGHEHELYELLVELRGRDQTLERPSRCCHVQFAFIARQCPCRRAECRGSSSWT